jgi:hypothetical protein
VSAVLSIAEPVFHSRCTASSWLSRWTTDMQYSHDATFCLAALAKPETFVQMCTVRYGTVRADVLGSRSFEINRLGPSALGSRDQRRCFRTA